MVDVGGTIASEWCLVQEETKVQKSLNLIEYLLCNMSYKSLTER